MTCLQYDDLFAAHLEGLLDEAAEQQLKAHLAGCETCQAALDETQRLVHRLEADGQRSTLLSITDDVMDRIVHEQAIRLRRNGTKKHLLRISMAAVVLIGLGIAISQPLVRPIGGRIYAAELSAGRKLVEDAKTATWKISYYQRFDGPLGVGSRWFRLKGFDQRYTFKSPGLYRSEHVEENGDVKYVIIEDQASRAKLDINPKTKTATLNYLTESSYPPHGPFERYLELMQREDLRPLGRESIASRPANGFRFEQRNGLLGEYRSVDFWLDAATKQLVECHQPGGDLLKTSAIVQDQSWDLSAGETLVYEGKTFTRAHDGGAIQGHLIREIAFDIEIDDAKFALTPPTGFAFKTVKPPQITEKDVLEFMGIVADYYDKTFPDRLPQFAQASKADLERLTHAQRAVQGNRGTPAEIKLVEAMNRWWQTGIPGPGPMHIFITQQITEGSWKYLGKGVKLGDKDHMVGWFRPKGSPTYRVIYGDLSVKDTRPDDLPLPVGQ